MHKRLMRILGSILVIANLLSSNMGLLVNACTINPAPTETVAAVETEAEKKDEASDITETSDDQTATEEVVAIPTTAAESETKETKETEETTAESSEDTESTETLDTSATAEPTATTAPTSSPKPEETTSTTTTVQETTAESSTETAGTSETTVESREAAEPSESSETSSSEPTVPTPTTAPVSETLTRKILDSAGNSYTVTASYDADTGIPFDAELEVKEITSGKDYDDYYNKTVEVMGDQDVDYVRIFDISIVKNGVELEPAEGTTVNVKIQLDDTITKDLSVVHFADDKTAEVVETSSVKNEDGTEIVFEADGFSAYAIVAGPDAGDFQTGWRRITTLDAIPTYANEIYIGHPDGFYMLGETYNVNNTRTGIKKTKPANTKHPAAGAQAYVFESTGTENQYKIHTKEDTPRYIKQSTNSLSFVTDPSQATAFKLGDHTSGNNCFYANGSGDYCINQQGSSNGNGFAAYEGLSDTNARLALWYYDYNSSAVDPYHLDGVSRGLMYFDSGVAGRGMMAKSTSSDTLDAIVMPVLTKENDRGDQLFVPNNAALTMWTFQWYEDDKYYIKADVKGVTNYLNVSSTGLYLSTTPQALTIVPGTGNNAGKIAIEYGSNVAAYSGTTAGGFESGATSNTQKWLNLVNLSELTSDYMLPYSAKKISVSDENLNNDSKVIIYTRVWNETEKKYEFYAVDHDGTLMRVFEEGDEIQWIDDRINTLLWDLTVYYDEDKPHTPENENYYYELYNEYSEKYIHPGLETETVLANDIIGINMNGRRDQAYFTPFIAWDKTNYGYAGVRTETETDPVTGDILRKIVSYPINEACPVDESKDFYFAVVQKSTYNEVLNEVATVDHTLYGITAKIIDFNSSKTQWDKSEQSVFLGSKNGGAGANPTKGLLSTNLGDDGYPTIATPNGTYTGQSLSGLFDSRLTEVNHLFLESTYKTSGYFEFDSTQNFAELDTSTNNFKVYQELGTVNLAKRPSMSHGQFMPFNHITEGVFADYNTENLYDALQTELSDNDPRKHEKLHKISEQEANYQFGLELETRFVQTPNGHDDWDHDIIYEFTGDDDFWLYVDDELVIDLGGVHSALYGSINYATGEVKIQETGRQGAPKPGDIVTYSLRDVFYNNYKGRGHSDAEAQAYVDDLFEPNSKGQYIFKDYTTHKMKIFFMERGGGASNLHMKFNQSSVRPGTVILSKELLGVENTESFFAEFPYQIFYQPRGENDEEKPFVQLTNQDENVQVYYRGTNNPVKFSSSYTIDGYVYDSVYFLKPGEACEIKIPDDAIKYYVKECGVNPNIYDLVTYNDGESTTELNPASSDPNFLRRDYKIQELPAKDRTSVEFENHVDQTKLKTLTFEKKLYDEHGFTGGNELRDDDTPFDFRLSFATEYQPTMTLADMYVYHVKSPEGYYCRWDSSQGKFVPIDGNKTDYTQLTAEEKKLVCFNTSMNGAISKIPAFYTVEVRELLVGTKFQVVERYNEIPDGYSRENYFVYDDASPTGRPVTSDEEADAIGTVGDTNPHVVVNNMRGYGIRMYKEFTDQKYVSERDATYFAAYVYDSGTDTETLIPGTVQRLKFNKDTLYWYFESLQPGKTLADYHIREVELTDPVVNDTTGYVTSYTGIDSVDNDGIDTITLNGKLKGDTSSTPSAFVYNVEYLEGVEITDSSSMRVDRIKNKRDGIEINKTDVDPDNPNPLAGAVFDLFDETGSLVGTFTSDSTGFVTMAYLRKGVDYSLVEKKSPSGYAGLKQPLTVRMNNDGSILVSANNTTDVNRFSFVAGPTKPSITVKNIRYNFSITKEDRATHEPVKGVVFSLHRQRTVGGVTVVDFNPIPGYESLATLADGTVPRIDNTLAPGTYELREIATPATHHGLNYYVLFTVTETGDIKLDEVHPEVKVLEQEIEEAGEKKIKYTLLIFNDPVVGDLTISKTVGGNLGDKSKDFDMTVTLRVSQTQLYTGTIYTQKNNGIIETQTITNGEVSFSLKHGENFRITGVDEGTSFTVVEDAQGYKSTAERDGSSYVMSTPGEVSGTIGTHHTVHFTNTLEGVIPTGVDLPFKLTASILCAMTAAVIVNTCLKMKRREDEED